MLVWSPWPNHNEGAGSVSDLIVFTYPTEAEAGQALAHVSSQEQQNVHKPLVAIEDAAVAIKKDNGKVKIRQTLESTAKGSRTIYGGFWGFLIGIIFGGPLLGLLIGYAVGGLLARKVDLGIDNDFIKSLSAELAPGNSALFLLVTDTDPEVFSQAMGDHVGTLFHTSLPDGCFSVLGEACQNDELRQAVEAEAFEDADA